MNRTYLLLGSNMGNSRELIAEAIEQIEINTGKLIQESCLYSTAAWGNTDQPDFLNQVILIETKQLAEETLQSVLSIEKKMGRVRTVKNAPRIIDIDILFFNKMIIHLPELIVPHPEIQNRRFALIPLNEIASTFIHPVLKKSIHELLMQCKDPLTVKKF